MFYVHIICTVHIYKLIVYIYMYVSYILYILCIHCMFHIPNSQHAIRLNYKERNYIYHLDTYKKKNAINI